MFEPVLESSAWIELAANLQAQAQDWVRVVATDADESSFPMMVTADQDELLLSQSSEDTKLIEAARSMLLGSEKTALHQVGDSTASFFFDVTRKPDFQLVLFGAGHVGRAIVNILRDLPIQINWVDSRDDQFPAEIPHNVESICSDIPEAEVDDVPAGSYFLVMTHDHALDQHISEHILKRNDFAYFGLIGSASKRRMFETRMQRRGISKQKFERMNCPIGVSGIDNKQPAAIAISVAAELMRVYDQNLASNKNNIKIQDKLRRAR